jgi:hypothetical protein
MHNGAREVSQGGMKAWFNHNWLLFFVLDCWCCLGGQRCCLGYSYWTLLNHLNAAAAALTVCRRD